MQRIILQSLITLITSLSFAQDNWSWEECVDYALKNNLEIQNSLLSSEKYKLDYQSSVYGLLPTLNARTGLNASFGKSVDYSTNDFVFEQNIYNNYGLYSQLRVFNSFSKINQLKFYKYNHLMSEADTEIKRNQVMFDVLDAFYNVALYEKISLMLIEKIKTTNREHERVVKMNELGVKAGSDVLEIKAQVATDSFLLAQNKANLELSYYKLMESMNISTDSGFQIELPLLPIETIKISNSKDVIDSAKTFLPGIRRLEYQLNASKYYLSIVKASQYPTLNLSGGVQTDYFNNTANSNPDPYSGQIENNLNQYIGLSLNIPIFNGLYKHNNVKKAKLDLEIKQNELDKKIMMVENEIKLAISDLNLARNEYLSAVSLKEARRISLDIAKKKYEKGLISIIEFHLVKNRTTEAEVQVLRTSMQLFLKERTLSFFIKGTIL